MMTETTTNTALRLEALLRLGGALPFRVRVEKAKDDRRNRIYERSVTATLEITWEGQSERQAIPSGRRIAVLARKMLAEQGTVAHADPAKASNIFGCQFRGLDAGDNYTSWSPTYLSFSAELRAAKPSDLPSEGSMQAWMEDTILPALNEAFLRVVEADRETRRREKAAKDANRIGQWAGSTLTTRAKAAVRYEQRLAALRAEMAAEVEVQAKAMREERTIEQAIGRGAEEEGEEGFEPEAIAYAIEHFPEYAQGWADAWRTSPEWRTADLFPEEQEFPNPETKEKAS